MRIRAPHTLENGIVTTVQDIYLSLNREITYQAAYSTRPETMEVDANAIKIPLSAQFDEPLFK